LVILDAPLTCLKIALLSHFSRYGNTSPTIAENDGMDIITFLEFDGKPPHNTPESDVKGTIGDNGRGVQEQMDPPD
jgi:hypothetical protein